MADLDEEELLAYSDAVRRQAQVDQWGYGEELLAQCVTLLHAIHIDLSRGIPVVQQKKQRRGDTPHQVQRPPWITGDSEPQGEVVVTSMRGLRPYLS